MRGKFTQYPAEFWKGIQMNAGVVVTGFVPGTGAFTGILGATSNGMTFTPNPTYEDFGSDIDNVPPNAMQLKRIVSYDPSLAGMFKTITPDTAAALCPGAVASGVITPATALSNSMFRDVAMVADYSHINTDGSGNSAQRAGYVAVVIKNALNTAGFQWKSVKDGKGEFAFDFHGHYDLENPDTPPFMLYVMEPVEEMT